MRGPAKPSKRALSPNSGKGSVLKGFEPTQRLIHHLCKGVDFMWSGYRINLAHSPGSKPSVKLFKVGGLATAGEARRIHSPPSVLLWRQLGKAEAL